jgi:hypothetical protein
VEDHHVDRPGVEAQQCVKLTGTNRSFGLIQNFRRMQGPDPASKRRKTSTKHNRTHQPRLPFRRPGGHGEGPYTRSHPELGRENPQRQWYCVLRRGRVGRRQVFRTEAGKTKPQSIPGHNPREQNHTCFCSPSSVRRYRGVEQPGSSSGS